MFPGMIDNGDIISNKFEKKVKIVNGEIIHDHSKGLHMEAKKIGRKPWMGHSSKFQNLIDKKISRKRGHGLYDMNFDTNTQTFEGMDFNRLKNRQLRNFKKRTSGTRRNLDRLISKIPEIHVPEKYRIHNQTKPRQYLRHKGVKALTKTKIRKIPRRKVSLKRKKLKR